MVVAFLAEDVLFLQCIAFSQRLYDVAQYFGKPEVQLGIITEARHGVLDFKNDGTPPNNLSDFYNIDIS